MPSVYAHYRFGCDVYKTLPPKFQLLVDTYREVFNLGLQGPDILFFYRPVYYNHVNQFGRKLHYRSGGSFFQSGIETIRNHEKKGASLAYLFGVACHFTLDFTCHPYVETLVRQQGLNHSAIEGAFERMLIVEDGLPLNTLVTGSIVPSKRNAFLARQVYEALKVMIWCNDGLRMKDNLLKKLLFFILRLVGKYDSIAGMVITPEPKPEFKDSDRELRRLYEKAIPVAFDLIQSVYQGVYTGTFHSPYFHHTYMN